MVILILPFVLLLSSVVRAANDWNTPCLNGQCSFDVTNSTARSTASGSLFINGSTNAISDLTPAAGWTILDCNSTTSAQDIRAICTGDNTTCSHLYQNGAVGTIVRLPENCGTMPFARIASEWNHENQSLPDDVAQKLSRRDEPATVRGISLDTQFSKVDPSRHGQVSMFVQGAAGVPSNITTALPVSNITTRGLDGRSFLSTILSPIKKVLQDMSFNVDKSSTTTINVSQPFTVLNQYEKCAASHNSPAFEAGIKITVDAKAHADVTYGIVAQGSIVPPKVTEFGLFADFDATLDGTLNVDALASISLHSGTVKVFEVGLPGLDFPGVLSLGPTFQLNAEATAAVTGNANMSVDLAYSVTGAQLFFPPNTGSSKGTFAPSNTNLQLSAAPSVSMDGSIEAHIIPTILFGINALDGLAEANINLDLDAYAELELEFKESPGSLSGCTGVTTGFNVNAGVDASFFDLFSKSTTVTLYSKAFDLFKKCFTGSKQRRDHAKDLFSAPVAIKKRGITCLSGVVGTQTSIVDSTIPSQSVGSGN